MDNCHERHGIAFVEEMDRISADPGSMRSRKRQDAVAYLTSDDFMIRDELKEHLRYVYDLERLGARVAYGSASPRDVLRLVSTLGARAGHLRSVQETAQAIRNTEAIDTCQDAA